MELNERRGSGCCWSSSEKESVKAVLRYLLRCEMTKAMNNPSGVMREESLNHLNTLLHMLE